MVKINMMDRVCFPSPGFGAQLSDTSINGMLLKSMQEKKSHCHKKSIPWTFSTLDPLPGKNISWAGRSETCGETPRPADPQQIQPVEPSSIGATQSHE